MGWTHFIQLDQHPALLPHSVGAEHWDHPAFSHGLWSQCPLLDSRRTLQLFLYTCTPAHLYTKQMKTYALSIHLYTKHKSTYSFYAHYSYRLDFM